MGATAPIRHLQTLRSEFWVVATARFVNRLGAFSLGFLSLYLVRVGRLPVETTGLVLTGFGAATIPSRLAGGWISDHIGNREALLIGLVATSASQVGLAVATSTTTFAVFAVALGLSCEIFEPATASVVAASVPQEERTLAFGILALVMNVAGMLAGLVAAVVAGAGLRWLFVIDAATTLLAAAFVGFGPVSERSSRPEQVGRTTESWRRDRRLAAVTVTNTLFAILYLQLFILLPLTITDRGESPRAIGVVLTISASVVVVAGLAITPYLAHLPHGLVLRAGLLLFGTGLCLNATARTLPRFVAAAVIWASADLAVIGRLPAVVADIAPPDQRGRYLAVYGSSWGTASVIAPLIGTSMYVRLGAATTWWILGLVSAGLVPIHRLLAGRG